jgi:hypothetical protein
MPIRLHIDDTRRRLCTRAEGLVTFAEMRDHVRTELSQEAAAYSELIDCTGATTNVTGDEIRQLAKERQTVDEQQRRPGAVAIVATDNVFFGMLRMFDMLTDRVRPIRVFRNVREARQWLDDIADPSDAS